MIRNHIPKILLCHCGRQLTFSLPESVIENPYSLGLFVLRQSGMERLYKFVDEYHEGWGEGFGRAKEIRGSLPAELHLIKDWVCILWPILGLRG